MKKFQQLVMAFLVGVVSFGFTACSDDNSEPQDFQLPEVGQATVNVNSSDKAMQKVAKVYVDQVVYPTYKALAANARTLYTTTAALYSAAEAGTMTRRLTLLAKPSRTHVASGSAARLSSTVRLPSTSSTHTSTHGLSTTMNL